MSESKIDFNSPEYQEALNNYNQYYQYSNLSTQNYVSTLSNQLEQTGGQQPAYSGGRDDRNYSDRGGNSDYSSHYSGRDEPRGGYGRDERQSREDNRREPADPVAKPPDTVYISGISKNATKEQLAQHFGSIGLIKTDKRTREKRIVLYYKDNGELKGDGVITYEDPETCTAAIDWFNGKEFMGSVVHLELASRKEFVPSSNGRGGSFSGGRGGYGGRGGDRGGSFRGGDRGGDRGGFRGGDRGGRGGSSNFGEEREGDWTCPSCDNNNWAKRNQCNRCKTPKPGGSDGGRGGSSSRGSDRGYGSSSYGGDRGSQSSSYGDSRSSGASYGGSM
eukprot:TRINITY_DN294_c0_g1_i4.p1 TRINITY_DN294_c0_g1~~TRINITY_DN294_c0_g1_i4.p1  ORF type:complete len:382 (-),score=163.84 TRINITY_DN294_c0_g1_i4:793-1791(-)